MSPAETARRVHLHLERQRLWLEEQSQDIEALHLQLDQESADWEAILQHQARTQRDLHTFQEEQRILLEEWRQIAPLAETWRAGIQRCAADVAQLLAKLLQESATLHGRVTEKRNQLARESGQVRQQRRTAQEYGARSTPEGGGFEAQG